MGLSDHTPGHATVLGSVALGARVIEKHFTDDTNRDGPDHKFDGSQNLARNGGPHTRIRASQRVEYKKVENERHCRYPASGIEGNAPD